MTEANIKDFKIKIELLQEKVWDNEDKISQNIKCIAKHNRELLRLKKLAELLQYEFATLEKDLIRIREKENQNE